MQQAAIQLSLNGRGRPRRWAPAAISPQSFATSRPAKDQRLVEEELEAAAAGAAPSSGHRPLPQLPGGGEGDAEVVGGHVVGERGREVTGAVQRDDVGVEDDADAGHGRSVSVPGALLLAHPLVDRPRS
jgi:hypothetical protein